MPSYDRFRAEVARVQAAHPDVELYLIWNGPDEPVILHLIRTLPVKRGRGLAEAALRDVLALADAWQAPVRLVAESVTGDTDVDQLRLIAWYERHGFRLLDPDREPDQFQSTQRNAVMMYRHPRPASPNS